MVNLGEENVKQLFEKMLKFHISQKSVNWYNVLKIRLLNL